MDKAKKLRIATRGSFTRTCNELKAEIQKAAPDLQTIKRLLKLMEMTWNRLEAQDKDVIDAMVDAECSDDEIEGEQQTIDHYASEYVAVKITCESILENTMPTPSPTSTASSAFPFPNNPVRYKLPETQIRKFNGEIKEWLGFWNQFSKIHNDTALDNSDKFQYLVQSMTPDTEVARFVDSYPQTGTNYPDLVAALEERFGNKKLLQQFYVRELIRVINCELELKFCSRKPSSSIASLHDNLESNFRALKSIGIQIDQNSLFLYPMVESCLPEATLIAWQRHPYYRKDGTQENPPKTDLDFLMTFLREEAQSEAERDIVRRGFNANSQNSDKGKSTLAKPAKPNNQKVSTAAALHTSGKKVQSCIFCDKTHLSQECYKAQRMTSEQKKSKIMDKKCCFICLRSGHESQKCQVFVRCTGCQGKHFHLMCPSNQSKLPKEEIKTTTIQSNQSNGLVLLKTLLVRIKSPGIDRVLRILFDDGSQKSYIVKKHVMDAKCLVMGSHYERNSLFGGVLTDVERRTTYEVPLESLDGKVTRKINLTDKSIISNGDIPTVPYGPWMKELKAHRIWINDCQEENKQIDVLIGSDLMPQLSTGKSFKLECGLEAIQTIFGWTLRGPIGRTDLTLENAAMTITSLMNRDLTVSQLWDLETIGIKDPAESKTKAIKDVEVRQHFSRTVSRNPDGRYSVKLPWVGGIQNIPNNKNIALSRLINCSRKLLEKEKFHDYNNIFQEWMKEDFIEEVSSDQIEISRCHYIPHRPVFKTTSRTTPIRPVFDASCKNGRSASLNDCLEKGPNLIELIPTIMLRFREGRIGISADIRKAFQMIEIDVEERDFLRFLWWEDHTCQSQKIYRHKRVVFGVNCSPFILGAVIEHHLDHVEPVDQSIAIKLKQSFYVDNCLLSVNNYHELQKFKTNASRIMEAAKMELREWEYGNSDRSTTHPITAEFNSNHTQPITSVLGMNWNKEKDQLSCEIIVEKSSCVTKRSLLSTVNKVFDPMGFLSPAMLFPKLILQEAWITKLDWDETLPQEIITNAEMWMNEMESLGEIKVPRCFQESFSSPVSKKEFHIFCDASRVAYSAIIFIRHTFENGSVSLQLLQAKSRVAPIKKVTIPRLELLGCVIAARLTSAVKEALNYNIPTIFWSDSTTALSWIKGNDEWGTFVGNRVREICLLSNPNSWRHVPGILNPADLPSRGCSPKQLLQSRWWEGPSWLREDESQWPHNEYTIDQDLINAERKKSSVSIPIFKNEIIINQAPWFAQHFSSYQSNIRVMGWILRFISRCRQQTESSTELSREEIVTAEQKIFCLIQKKVFPNSTATIENLKVTQVDGLYRVETKLLHRQQESFSFRRPVLLPHHHYLVDQIIREEHLRTCHGGIQVVMANLREKIWIIKTRKAVRRIIQSCSKCRRFQSKPCFVPAAPLPENRVKDAKPFEITGVDLAGPLFLKNGKKTWIVLFTCAVIRAVHLELVESLSTDAFIMALSRFISRRGRPVTIYSDNGTNFRGTVNWAKQLDWKLIINKNKVNQINWIFNPPASPWWGGFWERLIQTVKGLLRKMLGNAKMNIWQLSTLLCQVEAVVNARPLTHVSEDPEDLIPLTPAAFLHDLRKTETPEIQSLNQRELRGKYKDLIQLKDELRSRFRSEYLGQLIQFSKKVSRELQVGEVVLVASENRKKIEWPMARVLELFPGADGQIRVARIKTADGEFIRALQRLIPLEVIDNQLPEIISRNQVQELETQSKSSRVLRRSARLAKKFSNN